MTTQTIQMTLDADLLAEVDAATRELAMTRSALIRAALTQYLAARRIRELERQHRAAYEATPQSEDDLAFWEAVESWGAE